MRILMVRANQGIPDSRVEKEICSLSKKHNVELLGWDRTKNLQQVEYREVIINEKKIICHLICIVAPQGAGYKKIAFVMFRFWIEIVKYIKMHALEYDAVHFCDFDTAAIAFGIAVKRELKVVYDIFDYYADSHMAPSLIRMLIRKCENYIIENSDAVLLCSEERINQIAPAKPKRTVIIHNTPSDVMKKTSISIKTGSIDNRKKIVYVGMLSEDRFLREIAAVIIANRNVEWHVAGFGALEDYFRQLEKEQENIFFYGKLKYSEALYLESKCDIMTAIYDPMVPNHKYAAPNKFYEALMLGKPIIMVKNTGMDKVVEKYGLGEVMAFERGTFEDEFYHALINLISGESKWSSKKNSAQKIYKEKYSWEIMEDRLLSLYRELKWGHESAL